MNKFEHISSPGPMSRLLGLEVVGGIVALYSEVPCPDEVVLKSSILSWYVKKWSNIGLLTSKSANKIQPPVVLLARRFPV